MFLMIRSTWILLALLLVFGCGGDTGVQHIGRLQVDAISPSVVHLGQNDIEGRIFGANLQGMSSVSFGDGVNIDQADVVNTNEISLHFSVSANAPSGPRMLTVYAAEGVFTFENVLNIDDNRVPSASFTVKPPSGFRTTIFEFDASRSDDMDGNVSSYHWKFGDGKSASGKSVTHKFGASGSFDVELTITDNRGATSTTARFVDVSSQPPVAVFTVSPSSGPVDTNFSFNASQSHDPDGKIVSYTWDFGDGATGKGAVVSHRYTRSGAFTIRLTVVDDSQLASVGVHSVQVGSSGGGDDDDDGGGGGGGGGSCDANNFFTNFFNVISVSGNTIVADQEFRECPGLCGEVRRPGGDGIREFVGDIISIDGNSITISTGDLPASTRPEPGERLNIVWRSCGS